MAWDVSRRFQVTPLYAPMYYLIFAPVEMDLLSTPQVLELGIFQMTMSQPGYATDWPSPQPCFKPISRNGWHLWLGRMRTWGRVPVFHQQSAVRCPSLSLCGMPQSRGTVRKSFIFRRSRCGSTLFGTFLGARHGIYLFICVLFPSSFFRTMDCLGTLLRGRSNSPLLLGSFSSLRSMMPGHHGRRIESSYKGGYYR